ncbi:hypothetical protein V1279_002473 [Bradyrhizobium sp. AZCC 1610]
MKAADPRQPYENGGHSRRARPLERNDDWNGREP